jgi:hypothetical protein
MRLSKLSAKHWLVVASTLGGCTGAMDTQTSLSGESDEVICAGTDSIAPFKELVIVDSSVMTSSAASNATGETGGALSFHNAMARLAGPSANVAAFTEAFLGNWLEDHQVGPGVVRATPNGGINALLKSPNFWPRLASGDLDMKRAPFRLLAVVNRLDLSSESKPNGEGRLVFGVVSPGGGGIPMTVIFEYNLPSSAEHTQAAWATRWHALGDLEFGPAFTEALSTVVDGYTARENLSQLRTSEVFLSNEWMLREFHLDQNASALLTATTAQAPDPSMNNSQALIDWVNENAQAILSNTHVVPEAFLGGKSLMAFPALQNFNFSGTQWLMSDAGQPLVAADVRHAFASQTCNGCHQSDVPQGGQPIDSFYHVSPSHSVATGDGRNRLSPFVLNVEIPHRTTFLGSIIPCAETAPADPGTEQPSPDEPAPESDAGEDADSAE